MYMKGQRRTPSYIMTGRRRNNTSGWGLVYLNTVLSVLVILSITMILQLSRLNETYMAYNSNLMQITSTNIDDNDMEYLERLSQLAQMSVFNNMVDEVDTESSSEETPRAVTMELVDENSKRLNEMIIEEISTEVSAKEPETPQLRYTPTEEEYENLLKVVEAEVTGDDPSDVPTEDNTVMSEQELLECKIRVAQVVLNRIEDPRFPNDMNGVIFQKNAFSPVGDGRFNKVQVNDVTRKACDYALNIHSPDLTQGALFFQMYYCKPNKYGDYLFTDPAGHEYYSYNK